MKYLSYLFIQQRYLLYTKLKLHKEKEFEIQKRIIVNSENISD